MRKLRDLFEDVLNTGINRFVYHTSNPIHRNSILKNGLIPKQESWGDEIKSDMNKELSNKKAIFVSNRNEPYYSTYDDDVWLINTEIINNKWNNDNYFDGGLYTLTPIPINAIKLIYKGTGVSME